MNRCTRCQKGVPLPNQAMCEDCWRDLGQMVLFEEPADPADGMAYVYDARGVAIFDRGVPRYDEDAKPPKRDKSMRQ